ncbi:MAG: rane protein of unknown function [Candidatus Saccharibacteria bacterium]|nr:rane protein of unknown function [Candidatus Saccharibacteria bacterium]
MFKTKIKPYLSVHRLLAFAGLVVLVFLSIQTSLGAQSFTQGYGADETLQRGMIIKIKESDTTKVEPVTYETADKMHGLVVDPNDAPVTISSEGKKVFVANSGHYDVLVTTQNGAINPGDYVAVSALHGIGMKAGTKELVVVGRALGSFDGKSGAIGSAEIKDSAGKTSKVSIGLVSLDISVSRNPNLKLEEPNLPEFLRQASEAIAGKKVNPVRVYIGTIIFVISSIIAAVLLYSGVRSGIISIGRNPLSKKSIIRSMFQVVITGLIIFVTGLFGVYLILKL